MCEYEPISFAEAHAGKYRYMSSRGNDYTARVYYRSNGEIDEDCTYTEDYCRRHHLGRFAQQEQSSRSSLWSAVAGAALAHELSDEEHQTRNTILGGLLGYGLGRKRRD